MVIMETAYEQRQVEIHSNKEILHDLIIMDSALFFLKEKQKFVN